MYEDISILFYIIFVHSCLFFCFTCHTVIECLWTQKSRGFCLFMYKNNFVLLNFKHRLYPLFSLFFKALEGTFELILASLIQANYYWLHLCYLSLTLLNNHASFWTSCDTDDYNISCLISLLIYLSLIHSLTEWQYSIFPWLGSVLSCSRPRL